MARLFPFLMNLILGGAGGQWRSCMHMWLHSYHIDLSNALGTIYHPPKAKPRAHRRQLQRTIVKKEYGPRTCSLGLAVSNTIIFHGAILLSARGYPARLAFQR